jgi:hypothetical protein
MQLDGRLLVCSLGAVTGSLAITMAGLLAVILASCVAGTERPKRKSTRRNAEPKQATARAVAKIHDNLAPRSPRRAFAYHCGGKPNELYNGSFGAKIHTASAPTISPAMNPLIMCPSQRSSPTDYANGEMAPSRAASIAVFWI